MRLLILPLFLLFGLTSYSAVKSYAIEENPKDSIKYCKMLYESRNGLLELLTNSKIRPDTIVDKELEHEYPYYFFDGNPCLDGMPDIYPEFQFWNIDSIDINAVREPLSKQNISVSTKWASIRNEVVLFAALHACGFIDSLDTNMEIDVSADSLGRVNKLIPHEPNNPFLNEKQLEKVTSYLDSCGLLITKIIPSDSIFMHIYSPSDFEALSLVQIPEIIQSMKYQWNGTIDTFYNYWFTMPYNKSRNISGTFFDDHLYRRLTVPLPDIDLKNYNDAVFVLSMIYVFGDHAVDYFLQKFNFSVELRVDSSGAVVDLVSFHGDSPLSNAEISRLKKFLIRNKIEFEVPGLSDNNIITVHFPDACYREELRPMQYYRRLDIHESMLRSLIHRYLTLKYPDTDS